MSSRAAELERTNGELGQQLLASKEQIKYLHLARRSEAQVRAPAPSRPQMPTLCPLYAHSMPTLVP